MSFLSAVSDQCQDSTDTIITSVSSLVRNTVTSRAWHGMVSSLIFAMSAQKRFYHVHMGAKREYPASSSPSMTQSVSILLSLAFVFSSIASLCSNVIKQLWARGIFFKKTVCKAPYSFRNPSRSNPWTPAGHRQEALPLDPAGKAPTTPRRNKSSWCSHTTHTHTQDGFAPIYRQIDKFQHDFTLMRH